MKLKKFALSLFLAMLSNALAHSSCRVECYKISGKCVLSKPLDCKRPLNEVFEYLHNRLGYKTDRYILLLYGNNFVNPDKSIVEITNSFENYETIRFTLIKQKIKLQPDVSINGDITAMYNATKVVQIQQNNSTIFSFTGNNTVLDLSVPYFRSDSEKIISQEFGRYYTDPYSCMCQSVNNDESQLYDKSFHELLKQDYISYDVESEIYHSIVPSTLNCDPIDLVRTLKQRIKIAINKQKLDPKSINHILPLLTEITTRINRLTLEVKRKSALKLIITFIRSATFQPILQKIYSASDRLLNIISNQGNDPTNYLLEIHNFLKEHAIYLQ